MEEKNKKVRKIVRVIYIAAGILLVVITVGVCVWREYGWKGDDIKENEQIGGNMEKQESNKNEYQIDVQEKDGNKLVKNGRAGISITIPNDWKPHTAYKVNDELKLKISKVGPNQPDAPSEIIDGVMMEIYSYENKDNLSLEKWMEGKDMKDYKLINFQKFLAAKREGPMLREEDDSFDMIPQKNSYFFSYFFLSNNKVREISCSAFGDSNKDYIVECERIINSLIIE